MYDQSSQYTSRTWFPSEECVQPRLDRFIRCRHGKIDGVKFHVHKGLVLAVAKAQRRNPHNRVAARPNSHELTHDALHPPRGNAPPRPPVPDKGGRIRRVRNSRPTEPIASRHHPRLEVTQPLAENRTTNPISLPLTSSSYASSDASLSVLLGSESKILPQASQKKTKKKKNMFRRPR